MGAAVDVIGVVSTMEELQAVEFRVPSSRM